MFPFAVMFREVLCVGSGGSSCWRVFASSERGKSSGSRVLVRLQVLLLVLLAGKASCDQTSAAPTSSDPPTAAQASVQYVLDVTVEVAGGGKEQSEVEAWLVTVFENRLERCLSPGNLPTTPTNTPTTQHTTPATIHNTTTNTNTTSVASNNTTTDTTSVASNNTTTDTTSVTLNNTTTNTTSVTIQHTTNTNTTSVTLDITTTATPTTSATRSTLESSNTITTTLENTKTTTPAAATTLHNNTTTAPTSESSSTITAAQPPTVSTSTAATLSSSNTTTSASGNTNQGQGNQGNQGQGNQGNQGQGNTKTNRRRRRGLDVGSSGTQSRAISSNTTTTGLFQKVNISCSSAFVTNTKCSLTLQLRQKVPACCILRTLCAASNTSSNISVVGTRAYKDPPQSVCSSSSPEEDNCSYSGPTNSSCSGAANAAYAANSANCSQAGSCSCSAYCNKTDAYYTFQISVLNPALNSSYASSLISQKMKGLKNCSRSSNGSCPPSDTGIKYKEASVTCGALVSNRQNCSVILHFVAQVPICSVAAAMTDLFQPPVQISFDGSVSRAAICADSNDGSILLTPQTAWINLTASPVQFCSAVNEFNGIICSNTGVTVVLLNEVCVQTVSTTAGPNVTVTPSNTSSSSTNSTSKPLNATTPPTTTATAAVPPSNETAESQANALLALTRDVSQLNSSQVDQLVSQLERLLSGPNVSLALGNTSVNIVSNLLNASPEKLTSSSNRIIKIVDVVGLKLVLRSAAETLTSPSVALSVKPVDGSNFQETSFSILDPSNVQVRDLSRMRRSASGAASIPQGSITLPASVTQNLTPEQKQQVSRVQFNFYQKSTVFQDKSLGRRRLNSGVLGASVANLSITDLKDNVVISLRNTEPVPANYVASCVFWDFTLNNRSGGWNPAGCVVQNSSDILTVCGCSHLTSFAVLLDLSRQAVISPLQNTILTYITYIGCGVSAIFLSVTLLTYLAFENLRKDIPSKILIQLCSALLLLNLVFLVDSWLALYTDAVGLCISTAWFLHYFLLVSFTWMGLEAVNMYYALVKVFNTNISRYMLKFSVVGWGVPMVVVIVVIAVNKDNYGLVSYGKFTDGRSDVFCWLKSDTAFYVAVVAYFCVIFVFNLIMFVVVLVQLSRIKRQNPHNLRHRSTLDDLRSVAGITVLLGLTWGFAFFAWGPVNLAFMYLFAIFNSFQGLFIFVFFCALKENVKRQWRTYLCCGKFRMVENSEWSRTTQKTVKKPLSNAKNSKDSQSNSSSSSTSFLNLDSSEQSSGISGPFNDRVITADEDANTDVVLNELDHQHRHKPAP